MYQALCVCSTACLEQMFIIFISIKKCLNIIVFLVNVYDICKTVFNYIFEIHYEYTLLLLQNITMKSIYIITEYIIPFPYLLKLSVQYSHILSFSVLLFSHMCALHTHTHTHEEHTYSFYTSVLLSLIHI